MASSQSKEILAAAAAMAARLIPMRVVVAAAAAAVAKVVQVVAKLSPQAAKIGLCGVEGLLAKNLATLVPMMPVTMSMQAVVVALLLPLRVRTADLLAPGYASIFREAAARVAILAATRMPTVVVVAVAGSKIKALKSLGPTKERAAESMGVAAVVGVAVVEEAKAGHQSPKLTCRNGLINRCGLGSRKTKTKLRVLTTTGRRVPIGSSGQVWGLCSRDTFKGMRQSCVVFYVFVFGEISTLCVLVVYNTL